MRKLSVVLFFALFLIWPNLSLATAILEIEPNDDLLTAQNIDPYFSLGFNSDIYSSSTVPWVSILATGNGTFDYFSFSVSEPQALVILDVDYGWSDYIPPGLSWPYGTIDTIIALWDQNSLSLITYNYYDLSFTNGAPGSINQVDPYIETILPTGQYVVGVAEYNALPYSSVGWVGNAPDQHDTYQLQVSVEGHYAPVPEPSTLILLGTGIAGLVSCRKKRSR